MSVPLPSFLPIVYRLAARLEQVEEEELRDDPALAAYVLGRAQELFGLTAVVSHYCLGAELEAWRASGGKLDASVLASPPLNAYLDVTARLANELGGRARVVGVLSVPATLLPLLGDSAVLFPEFCAMLGRAYLERGAGILLVAEAEGVLPVDEAGVLEPLRNVARFFDRPLIVAAELPTRRRIPVELLFGEADSNWRSDGMAVTAGEVPVDLPAERLMTWVEALS